jgi:hypothetical protein
MFDFMKKQPASEVQSELTTYRAIRDASKTWFSKVLDHPAMVAFELVNAAQQVGLSVKNRTIFFDDEELEGAMLMDFFLFDYRLHRKAPIEACVFTEGELNTLEEEYHRASLSGHLSLFEIDDIHEQLPRIHLRDLLFPDRPGLWLTDINLSASFRQQGPALIFTRILSLRDLNLTGGVSFSFDITWKTALIDGYQRAMWPIPRAKQPQRRIPHFYAQYLRFGLPQAFGETR